MKEKIFYEMIGRLYDLLDIIYFQKSRPAQEQL